MARGLRVSMRSTFSWDNSFEFDNIAANDPPARVPEPVTLSLFVAGLAGAAGLRRREQAVQD